jgi:hypothetical protein
MKQYLEQLANKHKNEIPDYLDNMPDAAREILMPIYLKRFQKSNFFLTGVGMPGAGKSLGLIRILSLLDVDKNTLEPTFDPIKQVVFTCPEFLDQVNATSPEQHPGKGILFDEIEIEAHSRSWSNISRQIELAVSTMRFKQNILAASLPSELQLNKRVRALRNARLVFDGIDFHTKISRARYYTLDYTQTADTHSGKYKNIEAKAYNVRYYTNDPEKSIKKVIKKLYLKKPCAEIVGKYELKKRRYLEGYYQAQVNDFKKEDSKDKITFEQALDFIHNNRKHLGVDGEINATLVDEELGIGITKVKRYIKAYQTKREIERIKRKKYRDNSRKIVDEAVQ